jgi:hypothetical protein
MRAVKEVFDYEINTGFPKKFEKLKDEADEAEFSSGYGSDFMEITQEDLKHMHEGKIIGYCDGEYTHYFRIKSSMEEALE